MPLLSRTSLLALFLSFAGCDLVYERPEPDFFTDFGEPYDVQITSTIGSPAGTPMPPYVSEDRLVVDVTYRSGCEASRFVPEHRQRDAETAELWLRHRAEDGSCESGTLVEERLVFALPAAARAAPRLVLLTPDQHALVLDRIN